MQKTINPSQLLRNSAAHLLTKTRKRAPITPVLKSLHWLPVCIQIDFKIILQNLKLLMVLVLSICLLFIPKGETKTYGEASFSFYGPHMWNSLPEDLKAAGSVDIKKKSLRPTFLVKLLI